MLGVFFLQLLVGRGLLDFDLRSLAVTYLAGIPWVRTGAYGVSLIGLLMIAAQII